MPVTVPEGTSIMRAAAARRQRRAQAVRHRHAEGVRLVPAVPRRDRGPRAATRRRARRSSPTASRSGPTVQKLTQLRSGVMELYISDHPLDCARPVRRTATAKLQDMAGEARRHRACATASTAENHLHAAQGREQPLLHFRPEPVHRLLALRARVRRSAGDVCADDSGPRLRVRRSRRARTSRSSSPSACRAARASRRARPAR